MLGSFLLSNWGDAVWEFPWSSLGFEREGWHILQPKCAVELQGSANEILRQDVLLLKHPLQVTRGHLQLHNPSSAPNTPVALDELCCPKSFQLHTQGLCLR